MKNKENESVKLQDTTPTLHIQAASRRKKKLTLSTFLKKREIKPLQLITSKLSHVSIINLKQGKILLSETTSFASSNSSHCGRSSPTAPYPLSSTAHHLHKMLSYLELHLVATEVMPFCTAVLLSYFQHK